MGFKIGIIGLPNAGKSTIFNALSNLYVPCEPYPFCTIEPNRAVVQVPDERLDVLASMINALEKIPATIEFIDVAGLVRGSSKGEGLGNQFLSNIRDVDVVAHVIRCFKAEDIPHVEGDISPSNDVDLINTELLLKDIEVVQRRLDGLKSYLKTQQKKYMQEAECLEKAKEFLEKGCFILSSPLKDNEFLKADLLTSKPFIYIANVDEENIGGPLTEEIKNLAQRDKAEFLEICGKLELEIAQLPKDEQDEFRRDFGLEDTSLSRFIKVGYRLCGLISFFTVEKRKLRAWTVKLGTLAPQAAGKIHSDMERGFICCEVINFKDLTEAGDFNIAKERGLIRQEGCEYKICDGDVITFRFAV
jgi:hypothetical protein